MPKDGFLENLHNSNFSKLGFKIFFMLFKKVKDIHFEIGNIEKIEKKMYPGIHRMFISERFVKNI